MKRILLILLLFAALFSGCNKSTGIITPQQVAAQAAIDDKLITTYLKNNNITASVVDSSGVSTGIYYVINTPGTGNDIYTSSTTITVGYNGWLLTNGTLPTTPFTSSGTTYHPSFVLGQVMRGWQLGIPNCKNGGTITLYIPSRYAYGPFAQPQVGLPANAILVFQITIYNITN